MVVVHAALLACAGVIGAVCVQGAILYYGLRQTVQPGEQTGSRSQMARRWLPLVVLVTMLVFVLVGLPEWPHPFVLMLTLAGAAILLAIAGIDLMLRIVPTPLVIGLVALGVATGLLGAHDGPGSVLLGGAIGFALFGLLVLVTRRLGRGVSIGMGDANLALGIGCLSGFPGVVEALTAGVVCGGIGALLMLWRSRTLHSTLPYAPYLVIGALYLMAGGSVSW